MRLLFLSVTLALVCSAGAAERALPFEPLVPNSETLAAMAEARRGNLERVTLDELQAVLDAGD